MNGKNTKKPDIQKDILKVLAEKPAIPLDEIKKKITTPRPLSPERSDGGQANPLLNKDGIYAVTRSIKNLVESGCIEMLKSDNKNYIKLTKKGKNKLNSIKLEGEGTLVSTNWDGLWRIIILDIPENRKPERESLRYLLKKANFICIKNTVWISPLPYEHLFTNIKKDLGLGTELMIIVTDKIDEETKKYFLNNIFKPSSL